MSATTAPEAIEVAPLGLSVRWPDGEVVVPASTLRAACRCAQCRAARLLEAVPVDGAEIRLTGAAPVGHYALQLSFSDGHERGIYPWGLLRGLA